MNKFPIFLITGASGSGKTTIIPELYKQCPEHIIIIDMDSLFTPLNGNWEVIKNVWIYTANELALNNKIVILNGIFTPMDFEQVDLKNNFKPYFIGLYCNDKERERRLNLRNWSDELINFNIDFNKWLIDNADKDFNPKMTLIDTSNIPPSMVALKVKEIIDKFLSEEKIRN